MTKFSRLLLASVSLFATNSFAQLAGSIDSTFGTNGVVRTFVKSKSDNLNALAVQNDDKILAAGITRYDTINNRSAFAVLRYHANGAIDSSFATSGKMIYNFNNGSAYLYAMKLQPDGKILLAGGTTSPSSIGFACIRLNTDGTLDTTFGNAGLVTTAIGTSDDRALSIYLHSDGRFVLGGFSKQSIYQRMALVRYFADGSIDSTFANAGIKIEAVTGEDIYCSAIETDSAGNYMVAGDVTSITSLYPFLKRYSSIGTLDNTFGTNGTWFPGVGNGFTESCTGIIKQPDGKLLFGLSADYTATKKFGVIRYLPSSWTKDISFGMFSGSSYLNTGASQYAATSITLQPDGKVITIGNFRNGNIQSFAMARYTALGLRDSAFGNSGLVITPILPTNDYSISSAAVVQSTGNIIMAGTNRENNVKRFTLVRYYGSELTVANPSNIAKEEAIIIYPNPVYDVLNISIQSKYNNITILNTLGETVFTRNNSNSFENIDVRSLAKGIYFVRVNQTSLKFIKK